MSEGPQSRVRNERLLGLIEFALQEGWSVMRTPHGYIRLSKAGCASIYTSAAAADRRRGFADQATWRQPACHADGQDAQCGAAKVTPGDDHV